MTQLRKFEQDAIVNTIAKNVNTKRKLQGKADWNDVSMTLYDPIIP